MIYTLESWREDNGYEKTNIPTFIQGLREKYKSEGVSSVTDEEAQRVMSILSTKRGKEFLHVLLEGIKIRSSAILSQPLQRTQEREPLR